MKRFGPVVLLFFLSPAIAELLSGSAPPVEFFRPIGFIIITCLYGSGAILARELTTQWQKGWLSLLVLGAAYGIIEEGLMVKSFFDPNWIDIGILGSYGRWAGVNWVWSIELILYHAIVSIAIPISLVGFLFPNHRNQTWLGKTGLFVFLGILVADVFFGFFLLTRYRPPALQYVLAIAVVVALVFLARRLPAEPFAPKIVTVPRSIWFWLTGFLGTIAFFVIFWGLPNTPLPPPVIMLLGGSLLVLLVFMVMLISGNGAVWRETHQLALIIGILSFFILLAPIREFVTERKDNPAGMTIVALITLGSLLWLFWRVRRRENKPVHLPSSIN